MKLSPAKNILIIKWGALGDLIMATSTIKAIRDQYPNAKITMISNKIMKELFPSGYIIDEYIFLNRSGRHVNESFLNQLLMIKELRKRKFDLAFNLKWKSERASVLTFLSGAKERVGYTQKYFSICYTHQIVHPEGRYQEVDRNLDIAKSFGIKVNNTNPLIYISGDDKKFAREFFTNNSLTKDITICIHPGASKNNRAWLPERYVELSKKLISELGAKILVTWGANELNLARGIVESIGSNAILSPNTKSIADLGAIIEQCKLFISVCTGPMNVANAVNTPIIALLGSTDPLDWSPVGEIHRTIKSPHVLEHYTDEDERKALDEISVQMVFKVVEEKWNELKIRELEI
ncbi:MAG: glycosyltransferase family 9 protein [Ignavibacteriales bacterium]|nr:glycosyltransferase family 9 protein [Ignavibacteriales bacterium]